MKVREIMSSDCHTVQLDESIVRAACLMCDFDIGLLPVLDEEGNLAGTVTDRDIVIRALAEGFEPQAPVSEIMTTEVISCLPDEDVESAAELMKAYKIRRMLVTDNAQHLKGVVSLADIVMEDSLVLGGEVLEEVSRPH